MSERKESMGFKLITRQQEQRLPSPVLRWLSQNKKKKGAHLYDYDNCRYLLITLGEKPNAGYRLQLVKVENGRDDTRIVVKVLSPAPGFFYPQIVTVPYLLSIVTGTPKVVDEATNALF
ncbi:protease complex subunit PrcB family protein [Polycladomyces subterraneus]|uniref:Protease complex subunit PrcB family protein n=1 Tax=Polycladomyces subterraneus TaxID=1016997 RepID=A0ABT8IR23_9BACL|nr:protease complex subunit PrcB family protein [Polycladomyces subterraneus]MDN4595250.1 protease complex subunit PrcB family protein [Polycladomyces subterraneus]